MRFIEDNSSMIGIGVECRQILMLQWNSFKPILNIIGIGPYFKNPNLTMEFIEAHPEYDWDWRMITWNPNLTLEFIKDHPEYHWDCM